jgi:molecular chaperone IbpA
MNYAFSRDLLLSSVGFERLLDAFSEMEKSGSSNPTPNYPPYNIVKQSENQYVIELAVAGFKREEIEITAEAGKLSVVGKVATPRSGEFLHRGIATRDFRHEFTLAETVVVRGADLIDGLLVVRLENVIPEEKKPRKILIGASEPSLVIENQQSKAA